MLHQDQHQNHYQQPSQQPLQQQQPPQQQQLRVCMVCDFFFPRFGGVENHVWSMAQSLLRLGHKVVVVTHAYDATDGSDRHRAGVRWMAGVGTMLAAVGVALGAGGMILFGQTAQPWRLRRQFRRQRKEGALAAECQHRRPDRTRTAGSQLLPY